MRFKGEPAQDSQECLATFADHGKQIEGLSAQSDGLMLPVNLCR